MERIFSWSGIGVCSLQPLAEQDLAGSNDVLEDFKSQIFSNQQQPDLASKKLPFLPDNSNQQITGESGRPNDQITS